MTDTFLQHSQGTRPDVIIDDVFPEGIVDMDFAHEAQTLLVATGSDTLSLLRSDGTLLETGRRLPGVRRVVWAPAGRFGAAVVDRDTVVCLDSRLRPIWDVQVTGGVLAVAIAPHGSHLAICAASGRTHIVSIDRRPLARFDTIRPLTCVHFLSDQPRLLGAAEFGHLCCHELDGTEVWNERIGWNIGNLDVTGCGRRILLAAFGHGVQVLSGRGRSKGAFLIDGDPCYVCASRNRQRIAVLTQNARVLRMNFEGEIQWAGDLSHDPPQKICLGPCGDRLFIAGQSGRLVLLKW